MCLSVPVNANADAWGLSIHLKQPRLLLHLALCFGCTRMGWRPLEVRWLTVLCAIYQSELSLVAALATVLDLQRQLFLSYPVMIWNQMDSDVLND